MKHEDSIYLSDGVRVNFIGQFGWAVVGPDAGSNIIPGISVRVLDKINTSIYKLSRLPSVMCVGLIQSVRNSNRTKISLL